MLARGLLGDTKKVRGCCCVAALGTCCDCAIAKLAEMEGSLHRASSCIYLLYCIKFKCALLFLFHDPTFHRIQTTSFRHRTPILDYVRHLNTDAPPPTPSYPRIQITVVVSFVGTALLVLPHHPHPPQLAFE